METKQRHIPTFEELVAEGRANPDHFVNRLAKEQGLAPEDVPDDAYLLKADQSITPQDVEKGLRLAKENGWDIDYIN